MATKNIRANKRKRGVAQRRRPVESRGAEAVTVAWMLTTMVTLMFAIAALIGWILFLMAADREGVDQRLKVLLALVQYSGVVTGAIGLLLAAAAYRVRRVPPPLSVSITAGAIDIAPVITLLVLALIDSV